MWSQSVSKVTYGELRFRRIKSKYEAELEDAAKELETLKEKSSKTRDELAKKEEENIVLSAVLKQKEIALDQLEQVRMNLLAGHGSAGL